MADLHVSPEELRPLVREIVEIAINEIDRLRGTVHGKIVLSEAEAAQLLELNPWQLRDIRLAGKIGFCRIVGARIRYSIDDIRDYLTRHRQPSKGC